MEAAIEKSAQIEFAHRVADQVEQLKEKGEPIVLTLNDKVRFVVHDLKSYYEVIQTLEQAESIISIRHSLAEAKRGETYPAEEVFAEIRKEHGISN